MIEWGTITNDIEVVTTTNMEDSEWVFISLPDEPLPKIIYIY